MSKKDTEMTLEQIEAILVCYPFSPFYCRSHLVVPNVSWGFLNHEADLLVMSKSRLLTEVEIKRSWADFLADFKKSHDHSHTLIARFYYAVPASIGNKVFNFLYDGEYKAKRFFERSKIDAYTEHNPKGYGLIIYDLDTDSKRCCITVNSSLLNNRPITDSEEKDLLRLLGLRVWNMKKKLSELQTKFNQQMNDSIMAD